MITLLAPSLFVGFLVLWLCVRKATDSAMLDPDFAAADPRLQHHEPTSADLLSVSQAEAEARGWL